MHEGYQSDILVFLVKSERFGIALAHVDRVVSFAQLSLLPKAPPVILGLLDLHGAPVPVFDLHALSFDTPSAYGASARLILGATEARRFAVASHEVIGVQGFLPEAVNSLEPLVPGAGRMPDVAQADGGLVLIYDPDAYLTAREDEELDTAMREHAT